MADRRLLVAGAAALLLGGCTVGNLRYDELLKELDGVMQVDRGDEGIRLGYRDEGPQASWPLRFTLFRPIQPMVRLLGSSSSVVRFDNPSGQARELAAAIVDKCTDNLQHSADTAMRLLLMASLDAANLNRIVAMDGLAAIATAHGLPLLPDLTDAELYPATPPDLPQTIEALRQLLPQGRAAGAVDPLLRERYVATLAALTRRPLQAQRIELVTDLANALRAETDPELRDATAAALRTALQHAIDWLLLDLLHTRDPELLLARQHALHLLHRAGGDAAVPALLNHLAAPMDDVSHGVEKFEDGAMRRMLIHMCGQLDAARGKVSVRLPGRDATEAVSPLQFLAEQVLQNVVAADEIDPFGNPMRTAALQALCWSLGRQVDADPAWVRSWYEEFLRTP